MYQVGSLIILRPDDPQIEDYWEAINKAKELSIDDGIYGVWTSQDEGSDLLAIIYANEAYFR